MTGARGTPGPRSGNMGVITSLYCHCEQREAISGTGG
jgi:hypothetical protein